MKKIIVLLLVFTLLVVLYQLTTGPEIEFESIDYTLLNDGTFIGEYSTPLVLAEVKVLINDEQIQDIQLIKHDCGKGRPAEKVIDIIINENNHQVDTVSGATTSSKVIMKAVENALIHSIERR